MMNNIKCRLFFEGDEPDIKKMLKSISTKKPRREIDFEKIIPYPENIYRGPLTAEAIKEHGTNNWYDFNKRYWEAYYNAYDTEKVGNMIEFKAAWKAPVKLISKLSKMFPTIAFTLKWCGEHPTSPFGVANYCDGFYTEIPLTHDEHERLYSSLWGVSMPQIAKE